MAERMIRWISRIVPRSERGRWLREWTAELVHARGSIDPVGAGGRGGTRSTLFIVIAAAEDAMGMRMRKPGSTGLGRDVRYAFRTLVRSPLFTVVSVVTLALGIGANTAIFSLLWGVLLRPLPYPDSDQLVSMVVSFGADPATRRQGAFSEPEYLDMEAELRGFQGLANYWRGGMNLGGIEEPMRVPGAAVSWDFFKVLGVSPALGRGFVEGEDRPDADPVAVISHGVWNRAFGSDPGVVGSSVLVNGSPRTVVGVMPPDFAFPVGDVDIMVPNVIDPANPGGRSSHYMQVVGRLLEGDGPEVGQARVDELLRRWNATFDRHDPSPENHPIEVVGLRERVVGDVQASLVLLMGAVGLVLLIACANVANLMLVRAEDRQEEMAIRGALGAERGDLVRQVLVESLLLSLAGGAVGVALAWTGVEAALLAGADFVPRAGGVEINGPVLLFTGVVALAAGIGFGLLPALNTGEMRAALQSGARRSGSGARQGVLRRLLVVAEVGTAVLLVVGAGVLLRSLARLQAVDPGVDTDGVIAVDFALNSASYPDAEDVAAFHEELDRRLEALPGVTAAGAIRLLPLRGEIPIESMDLMDRPRPTGEHGGWNAGYQVASAGYFKALGIPVLDGRGFTDSDRLGAPLVAVVNESMAQLHWPDGDPVGERIRLGWWEWEDNPNPPFTIVGVVGNTRQEGLARDYRPTVYVPRAQAGVNYGGMATRFSTLVVRSEIDPGATISGVRRIVREIDPDLPLDNVTTMEAVVERSVADERLLGLLMAIFSAVALTLGAVGIYGLVAYSVAARTREIGVRIALGADRTNVMRMVIRQAMVLSVAGVVLGVSGALMGARLLEGFLYEVSAWDPAAFTAGPLVLMVVALLAAVVPAFRAARVDPVVAMRAE